MIHDAKDHRLLVFEVVMQHALTHPRGLCDFSDRRVRESCFSDDFEEAFDDFLPANMRDALSSHLRSSPANIYLSDAL